VGGKEGKKEKKQEKKKKAGGGGGGGGGAVKATQNQELPRTTHSTQNEFIF